MEQIRGLEVEREQHAEKCRADLLARSQALIPLREAMINRYISSLPSSAAHIARAEEVLRSTPGDEELHPGDPHPDLTRSQALKRLLNDLERRHGAMGGGTRKKKSRKKSKHKKKRSKKKISKKKKSKKRTRRR